MATETIELRFLAELGDLRSELSKLPDIGEREAKKLVRGLERQYKQAEKAAKRMASRTMSSTEKMALGLEGVKNSAEGLGGAIGGAAGQVEKMIQSAVRLGASVGPVPAALGAGAVALGLFGAAATAAVGGVVSVIRSADELVGSFSELEGAGVFSPMDPAAEEALHTFADAMDAVGLVGQRLMVLIGADMAVVLEETAVWVTKFSLAFSDLASKLDLGTPILQAIGALFGVGQMTAAAFGKALELVGKATSGYDQRARDLLGTIREKKTAEESAGKVAKWLAAQRREQAAAEREAASAIRDAVSAAREQVAAQQGLVALVSEAESDALSAVERVNRAYDDRITKILEFSMAGAEQALVLEALAEVEERRARDLGALWEQAHDAQMGRLKAEAEEQRRLAQEEQQRVTERVEGIQALTVKSAQSITGMLTSIHETEMDALLERGDATKEQVLKLHKAQKRAAIAQTLIEAAVATIALIPAYSFAAAGAPALAAATVAVPTAASIAQIQSQKPPEFPTGGLVADRIGGSADHVMIGARPDESVLSPRATAALGREGVDALNRGALGPSQVVLQIDRRTVAEAVADASGRGLLKATPGRITGRSTVYGSG